MRCAATVIGMELSVDPETTRVVVVELPDPDGGFGWWPAITSGVAPYADAAAARRGASRLREELGLIGPEWVRRQEAATRLGVGVKMIDKYRRNGRLRGMRAAATNRAYVHRDDLAALLDERAGQEPQ